MAKFSEEKKIAVNAGNSDYHESKHGMMAKDQADSDFDFDLLQHDKEQAIEAQQQHQAAQQQQQPEAEPAQENLLLNDRRHYVFNRRDERQGLAGVIAAIDEKNQAAYNAAINDDDDPDLGSSFCTQDTDHNDNLTTSLKPVIRMGASHKVFGRPAQPKQRVFRQ